MRSGTLRLALVLTVLFVVLSLLPFVAGQPPAVEDRQGDTTLTEGRPATPSGEIISDIWIKVIWVSAAIFLLVTVLLVYALVRWRHRRGEVREVPQVHGNSKLEIAWTIGPALIMVWFLVISYNGLFAIDDPEEINPDAYVDITAHTFFWEYSYPDGSESTGRDSMLRLETGIWVQLNVTSADVHHAFKIPGLDLMIDAMPGRVNEVFLYTGDEPGVYLVQCMRFCGAGHGDMHSTAEIFQAGTQPLPYGDPPEEEPEATPPENGNVTDEPGVDDNVTADVDVDRVIEIELDDYFFIPDPIETEAGERIEFVVTNNGNLPHDMTLGFWDFGDNQGEVFTQHGERLQTPLLGPGQEARLIVEIGDEPMHVWCSPHMPSPGMWTNLAVDGEIIPEELVEPRLPGPAVVLVPLVLAGLFAFLRRRDR